MERMTREKILAREVGILDNNSEWLGIPKKLLMECAGYSIALEIIKNYDLKEKSRVVFFCGTGNNGGDGFVVARHLSSFGIKSHVILLGRPERIGTEEARLNWKILSNSIIFNGKITIAKDSTDVVEMGIVLDSEKHDLIVDAMLGTGIKGKLREPVATAVEFINEAREHQNIPVVSVDVPSGLDPDTGEVGDNAVKADLVITFHRNKKGMDTENEYIGEILVKSIGIPQEAQRHPRECCVHGRRVVRVHLPAPGFGELGLHGPRRGTPRRRPLRRQDRRVDAAVLLRSGRQDAASTGEGSALPSDSPPGLELGRGPRSEPGYARGRRGSGDSRASRRRHVAGGPVAGPDRGDLDAILR